MGTTNRPAISNGTGTAGDGVGPRDAIAVSRRLMIALPLDRRALVGAGGGNRFGGGGGAGSVGASGGGAIAMRPSLPPTPVEGVMGSSGLENV